jgi:hypothetical protein
MEITPEILAEHQHISTEDVTRDRDETLKEVADLVEMEKAERILAQHHLSGAQRTMYAVKAEARAADRVQRQALADFLTRVLAARAEAAS